MPSRSASSSATAGDRVPGHRRHERLRQAEQRPDHLGETPHEARERRRVVAFEGQEIEAGAEELRMRGAEEHAVDAVVLAERVGGLDHRLHQRLVDRVPAVLVEAEERERPVPFDAQAHALDCLIRGDVWHPKPVWRV
jgi:hypothetical protein